MTAQTVNRGANLERTAILAKLRRMRRRLLTRDWVNALDELDRLIVWVLGRNERYAKRKGVLKGRVKRGS